jgi:hypothetical protein
MDRNLYYVGIAFFGMINGIFNPLILFTYALSARVMSAPLFDNPHLVFYFASLMLSTGTVILGGIPAALYERFIGARDDSTETSLWIWLGATGLLSVPAIGNFLRVGL